MILVELPTKTIALIVAMAVIGLFIVAGIIVTLVITQSERFNKQVTNKYVYYLKEIKNYHCPKCGGEFQIYRTKDYKTLYKCVNDKCVYKVDPETIIKIENKYGRK